MTQTSTDSFGHVVCVFPNRAPDEHYDTVGEMNREGGSPMVLVRHRQHHVFAVARPTTMDMNNFEKLKAACRTRHEHVAAIYSLYITQFQKTMVCELVSLRLRDLTLKTETEIASAMGQFLSGLHFLRGGGSAFGVEGGIDGVAVSSDGTIKLKLDFGFGDSASTKPRYWLALCKDMFGWVGKPVLSCSGRDFMRLPSAGVIPPRNHTFLNQSLGAFGLLSAVQEATTVILAVGPR